MKNGRRLFILALVTAVALASRLANAQPSPCGPESNCGTSRVVFREIVHLSPEVFWMPSVKSYIPGFDHVALEVNNRVYESHPGYPEGLYSSADGKEVVSVADISGVQSQHTLGTFTRDAKVGEPSPISQSKMIVVPKSIAEQMMLFIKKKISEQAGFLRYRFTLDPLHIVTIEEHKGAHNNFTCVGLIESAAEFAGVNGGEGFVRNTSESFLVPIPMPGFGSLTPLDYRSISVLSPQLLYDSMSDPDSYSPPPVTLAKDIVSIYGAIDPVDFLITDPVGRRIGHTPLLGTLKEIPTIRYTGPGDFEQFQLRNPLPGRYTLELLGKDGAMSTVVGTNSSAIGIDGDLFPGQSVKSIIDVPVVKGAPGDVNFDGGIDEADITVLGGMLGTSLPSLNHPADVNQDGKITSADLTMLQALLVHLRNNPKITCGFIKATQSSGFRKAAALVSKLQSKVRRISAALLKKKAVQSSSAEAQKQVDRFNALMNPTASLIDSQLEIIAKRCTIIPPKIYQCGEFLPANCRQYALQPSANMCRKALEQFSKLSAQAINIIKKEGGSAKEVKGLAADREKFLQILKVTPRVATVRAATVCE